MALSDSLSAEVTASLRGPRCTVCALVPGLGKDDRTALEAALNDRNITSAAISRALRREGHAITESTLRRHRKGECLRGEDRT